MRRRPARARRRDERGAVVVMVAAMMALLLIVAAFAVDLGMQRVVRRDMQAVADVVSMDMVRVLDGRTKSEYTSGELDAALRESLARNSDVVGDAGEVTYEIGTVDARGEFESIAPGEVPDAVRVEAPGSVDFAFAPGRGEVVRAATATASSGACFTLGSYAARVRTGDSWVLGPLLGALGTGVDLDVLDVRGLANANVSLLDLVNSSGLGVGSFDELVDLPLQLGQFYVALAEVLAREAGRTAEVVLLETLGVTAPPLDLTIGEILNLESGGASGLDAALNVLDLVSAAAFVANGDTVVAIPNLNVNVLGVSRLNGEITIGQKANQGCGRPQQARAESSQVDVSLSGNLANINLGLASISAPLDVTLSVVPAEGTLERVTCGDPDQSLAVLVSDGLLDLRIELEADIRLVGLPLARGPIVITTERSQPPTEVPVNIPGGTNYDTPGSVGQGNLGIPRLRVDTSRLTVLGVLPVGGLLGVVVNPLLELVLNPLVKSLDSLVLSPLLESLGINVAGAEVFARPTPSCGVPVLQE